MAFLNWLAQVIAVTAMNVRNIPRRWSSSIVTILGVAGVVAVFVSVLSISQGFEKTLASGGSESRAIVLRGGAQGELSSNLLQEEGRIISEAPGVMQDAGGPLSSAELLVVVDVPKKTTGTDANVPMRGVQDAAFRVRDGFNLIEGRQFREGLNEVIVGRAAQAQFADLELGATPRWGQNNWTIVGVFEAGGAVAESEVWTDLRVLQSAYNRGTSIQSVRAVLTSPDAFTGFKDALTADPRLNVLVQRETEFYADQGRILTGIINSIGSSVAALMGIGAIFGAILTMYTAVSARTREIATLRALGYGAIPVVISVFVEAILLGLIGGLMGAIIAFVGFNGFQTSTINFQSFTQVSFAFQVTPVLLQLGIMYALMMGLIGGLLPSIRAARLPITTALREL